MPCGSFGYSPWKLSPGSVFIPWYLYLQCDLHTRSICIHQTRVSQIRNVTRMCYSMWAVGLIKGFWYLRCRVCVWGEGCHSKIRMQVVLQAIGTILWIVTLLYNRVGIKKHTLSLSKVLHGTSEVSSWILSEKHTTRKRQDTEKCTACDPNKTKAPVCTVVSGVLVVLSICQPTKHLESEPISILLRMAVLIEISVGYDFTQKLDVAKKSDEKQLLEFKEGGLFTSTVVANSYSTLLPSSSLY